MRKNVASQHIAFQMNSSSDGSPVTSGTPTVYYTIDAGTQGTGAGSSVHEGNGQWSYAPAQAETNGAHVAFTMALSGAISQTVNLYPVSYDPGDAADLGVTALTGHTPQTGDSYAEVTNGTYGLSVIETLVDELETRLTAARAGYLDNLNGHTAQTGDNFGRLGAPAGASIAADIAALPTDADVNAQCDQALTDYDGPTNAEMTARTLAAASYATAAAQTTAQNDLDILTGIDGVTLATSQLNYTPSTSAEIAALDTVVDRVETDTQDIQSRLPAALVTGRMSSDAIAISGSTDAADKLEASAETIETGAAQAGTLSTTQMTTNLTEATDDHYNGRIIVWTSGNLLRQATDVTDYAGTNGLLTFTATTEAPQAGDTFILV